MALTDNIIGCWSPSVRGSGYLLPDLSGRGNHGTLTNMAGDDWVGASVRGVSGRELDFDGANDYIVVGTSNGLWASLTGALTVSCWIRVSNNGGLRAICAASTSGHVAPFAVTYGFLDAGKFQLWNTAAGASVASSQSINDGKWHHCVATRGGAGSFIFIDGAQSNSAAGTTGQTDATATLSIGRFGGFNGYYADFRISEVVIYNRALTATEIAELYRRGNGAIGRELTGQTRRRVYGFVPAGFRPYWVRQKSQIIGGGV